MQRRGILKKVLLTSVCFIGIGLVVFFSIFAVLQNSDRQLFFSLAAYEDGGPASGEYAGTQGNGQDIVALAQQEYENARDNVGGFKYKDWYGMNADWCAMFVCWLAEQCGYIEQGIFPRTASVYGLYSFFKEEGRFHYKEESYRPQPGDVIIYDISAHTGLVVDYDVETDMVTTIEGNTGTSSTTPFHLGSQVNRRIYPRTSGRITGFGNPQYPLWGNIGSGPLQNGEEIMVPTGLGAVHTYMAWQMITSPSSLQYRLKEAAGMNFDAEGFGRIGDRYVIACTTTFGGIGDYVDFYKEDGTVIKGIIGDIKNQNDSGCNQWGHLNGTCIVEFVVDRNDWYNRGHANPGTSGCHPEWNKNITKVVNRGNYWG